MKGFSFLTGKDTLKTKFIVVTGGSLSGVGKGTIISSLGVVLKCLGFRVTVIKIDPYLNVDAGTMSPYEHGEVFVLEDGGEVDLDLGNYERFLNVNLTRAHNITSGKIFQKVISDERNGEFLGKTVQVVPHVVSAVERWILEVSSQSHGDKKEVPELCLIEVGGTVGDIESSFYLEALQQMSFKMGQEKFCFCHVSYIPCLVSGVNREQKTKPAQHALKVLREGGIRPDFIFCRCEYPLAEEVKGKISLFGQVPLDHVIGLQNVSNIYKVPLMLMEKNVGSLILKKFNFIVPDSHLNIRCMSAKLMDEGLLLNNELFKNSWPSPTTLSHWKFLADRVDSLCQVVKIGIVGKYTGLSDSYLSVVKALLHACTEINFKLEIVWIDSSSLTKMSSISQEKLESVDGVVCPGGFGDRGIEGKMLAAKYCREMNKPYLGICLGMQTAIIEFSKNVLGLDDPNSEEFDISCQNKVIKFMPEFHSNEMGGSMRLGNRATIIKDKSSLTFKLYNQNPIIYERHRHRYEVNTEYVTLMESKGLKFVGNDEKGSRMEIAELENHPFFLCVQFHPEFTSRPMKPSPFFLALVLASVGKLEERLKKYDNCLLSGILYNSLQYLDEVN